MHVSYSTDESVFSFQAKQSVNQQCPQKVLNCASLHHRPRSFYHLCVFVNGGFLIYVPQWSVPHFLNWGGMSWSSHFLVHRTVDKSDERIWCVNIMLLGWTCICVIWVDKRKNSPWTWKCSAVQQIWTEMILYVDPVQLLALGRGLKERFYMGGSHWGKFLSCIYGCR